MTVVIFRHLKCSFYLQTYLVFDSMDGWMDGSMDGRTDGLIDRPVPARTADQLIDQLTDWTVFLFLFLFSVCSQAFQVCGDAEGVIHPNYMPLWLIYKYL